VLARRILVEDRLVALVPLAPLLGISFFIVISNLLAYPLGPAWAFRVTFPVLVVLAAVLLVRPYRQPGPLLAEGRVGMLLYVVMVTVLGTIIIANYLVLPTWDYQIHFDLATRLSLDYFPLMNPGAPHLPAKYHYGSHLLVAALMRLGHVPVEVGFFFYNVGMALFLFLLAYAMARVQLGARYAAVVPALMFCFDGGFAFLAEWFQHWHLQQWAKQGIEITITQRDRIQDLFGPFVPTEFAIYPRYLSHPHVLSGWSLLLTLYYVLLVRQERSWPGLVLAAVVAAALALVEESLLALGLAGLGLYFVVALVGERVRSVATSRFHSVAPLPPDEAWGVRGVRSTPSEQAEQQRRPVAIASQASCAGYLPVRWPAGWRFSRVGCSPTCFSVPQVERASGRPSPGTGHPRSTSAIWYRWSRSKRHSGSHITSWYSACRCWLPR